MGSQRVRHDWATSLFTFHFHALEKEMAIHSSVLAWRIPEMGEPGGLLSMGSHRVGHDWSDLAAAAATAKWSLFWVLTEEWRWLLWILSFHPLWPRGVWQGKCAWLVRSVHSWCPGEIWSHSTFRAPFRVTVRSSWPLVTSIVLP